MLQALLSTRRLCLTSSPRQPLVFFCPSWWSEILTLLDHPRNIKHLKAGISNLNFGNPWPSLPHPDNLKNLTHFIHSLNIKLFAWYLKAGINLTPCDYCCSPLKLISWTLSSAMARDIYIHLSRLWKQVLWHWKTVSNPELLAFGQTEVEKADRGWSVTDKRQKNGHKSSVHQKLA